MDIFNFENFDARQKAQASAGLRALGQHSATMEEAANEVVDYLYRCFRAAATGEPACALVRCFKTHRLGDLPSGLHEIAVASLRSARAEGATVCLTLLATRGARPEWNSRHDSQGHKAIPLASTAVLARAPMIARLVEQFGLDPHSLLDSEPGPRPALEPQSLHVFHVEQAVGSEFVPIQSGFVIPMGIESVLGFGGLLPDGDLFCVLIFSSVHIVPETAALFQELALEVRHALLGLSPRPVFTP